MKTHILQTFQELDWSTELEPEGLIQPQKIEVNTILPQSLITHNGNKVYAELDTFGSLDNSLIPKKLITQINTLFLELPHITNTDFIHEQFAFLSYYIQYVFENVKISRFIYGKPYIIEQNKKHWEIPLRLYTEKKHIDVLLYVLEEKNTFTLEQMYIGDFVND